MSHITASLFYISSPFHIIPYYISIYTYIFLSCFQNNFTTSIHPHYSTLYHFVYLSILLYSSSTLLYLSTSGQQCLSAHLREWRVPGHLLWQPAACQIPCWWKGQLVACLVWTICQRDHQIFILLFERSKLLPSTVFSFIDTSYKCRLFPFSDMQHLSQILCLSRYSIIYNKQCETRTE